MDGADEDVLRLRWIMVGEARRREVGPAAEAGSSTGRRLRGRPMGFCGE